MFFFRANTSTNYSKSRRLKTDISFTVTIKVFVSKFQTTRQADSWSTPTLEYISKYNLVQPSQPVLFKAAELQYNVAIIVGELNWGGIKKNPNIRNGCFKCLIVLMCNNNIVHDATKLSFHFQLVKSHALLSPRKPLSHLIFTDREKGRGTVRILFPDFLSAFNTIQPHLLPEKLIRMRMDPCMFAWISSYLPNRPQYVRLKDITSDTVVSSIGAPQGTVLSPLLFTLYTANFRYNSEICHIWKFADDTAIMGCVRDDEEEEYRSLVRNFVVWCHTNNLQLVIGFGKDRPRPRPVLLRVREVEVMETYKYIGLWLDNKLGWTRKTKQLYKMAQSRMYNRHAGLFMNTT